MYTFIFRLTLVIFVLHTYYNLDVSCRKKHTRQRSLRKQNYNSSYIWEVGKWNQCLKGKSCDEPGIQRRILSCIDSARRKTASKKCNRKQRPNRRRTCVPLPCKNQTNFKLRFWPWSSCASQPLSSIKLPNVLKINSTVEEKDSNFVQDNYRYNNLYDGSNWRAHVLKTCGSFKNTIVFIKKRNVSCFAYWPKSNTHIEVEIENCLQNNERRPKSLELCSFGCKKKCVVSLWSGWKSCENCRKKIRYRKRAIADAQIVDGKMITNGRCPSLLQTKLELGSNKSEENIRSYQFHLTKWSSCQRIPSPVYFGNKNLAIGIRKRSMNCVGENGKLVNCERTKMEKIPLIEGCIFPRNCNITNWGEWSTCKKILHFSKTGQNDKEAKYVQKRTRHVVMTSLAGGKPCSHFNEFRSCHPLGNARLEEIKTKNASLKNETFEWFSGKFDQCKHDGDNCGSGITRRDVFCIKRGDMTFKPVSLHFCAHMDKPNEEKFCGRSCRQICVFGEWSAWSGCIANCRENSTGPVQGTHYRARRVMQYSGDPRACADYAESRPCFLKDCVSWTAGTQTVCLMDNIHRTCGNGRTHRSVYCLNAKGYQVKNTICKGKRPPRSLPCHVPCADDCVLGTWSDWGPCEGECGLNGTQSNGIQMRKQRILAYSGWSGKPCPSMKERTEQQSCLGVACGTYHWKVGPWSSCLLKSSRYGSKAVMDMVNRRCFVGYKLRTAACLNAFNKRVRDNLCTASLKPSLEKECHLCPEDCVLSQWTQWTDCPSTCTGSRQTRMRFRKRQKFIVTPGKDGGLACPRTDELVQQEECDDCAVYLWKVSEWTRCLSVPNGSCKGFQTREVYCIKRNGMHVYDGFCLDMRKKPEEIRNCHTKCNENCNLTSWSSWSKCSTPCGSGLSTRTRNVIGNQIRCSPGTLFIENTPCNTHNCGHYSLRISKWSTCHATDLIMKCGAGVQWRNISCFKINGIEAALDYCIDELYDGRMVLQFQRGCKIECPLKCKLSPWTEFTPCSRKCGAGIKTRFRTVIQQGGQGGDICTQAPAQGQITEKIPCREKDCYHFRWKPGPWGECQLTNVTKDSFTKCGTGYHTRMVYCIDKQYIGKRSIINSTFCDAAERPIERKACTLSCPGECVVGFWSSWSKCSSRCPRPGHKRRERSVLRYPAHDKKSCPPLEEYKTCNINKCYAYYWRVTQWSSCLFFQENATCGVGRQKRMADCSRSDGKIVHPFYCRVEGRRVPILIRMCNVPCPKNCEISQWGAWSGCPETCHSSAVQVRNRFVLAKAENGGQPCSESDELQEFRACRMKPCYKVSTGQWSDCFSDLKNSCGMATKRRAVYCVRDDGKRVRDFYCSQINKESFQRLQPCEIPCKGDCIVTEWSSWSSCLGACSLENKTVLDIGSKVRTRVILQQAAKYGIKCPTELFQKEQCYDPLCFTYSWKMSSYVGKLREVWCERSDGMKVTRGCNPALKPSTSKTCQPPCSVRNSFCDSNTICTCGKNYVAIFGSTGHLIHCFADTDSNILGNKSLDIVVGKSDSSGRKNTSWFSELPIIIWVVIGVCFLYLLLFLAIIIVYTRRRTRIAKQRRANTTDVGTITTPERIPLTEKSVRHERTDSKTSFATSSGRGSTLSAISDHEDGEQWPDPPEDVVSEFIRHHLKNFTGGSFCSDLSDEVMTDGERERTLNSLKKVKFEVAGTL